MLWSTYVIVVSGISGSTRIADVGGVAYLAPVPDLSRVKHTTLLLIMIRENLVRLESNDLIGNCQWYFVADLQFEPTCWFGWASRRLCDYWTRCRTVHRGRLQLRGKVSHPLVVKCSVNMGTAQNTMLNFRVLYKANKQTKSTPKFKKVDVPSGRFGVVVIR